MSDMAKPKGKTMKRAGQQRDKTYLGDPYRKLCPVLEESDLLELKGILIKLIKESGKTGRQFATASRINIGLESSLRTINQKRAACVIVSLSIKPHCLIGLIARNSEVQDESVPVYAQPKLECICEEIFGFRSLALVFPKDLQCEDSDLKQWISSKQKTVEELPESNLASCSEKSKNSKRKQHTQNVSSKLCILEENGKMKPTKVKATSKDEAEPSPANSVTGSDVKGDWSGDYISLTKNDEIVKTKVIPLSDDKNVLNSILSKMKQKVSKAREPESSGDSNNPLQTPKDLNNKSESLKSIDLPKSSKASEISKSNAASELRKNVANQQDKKFKKKKKFPKMVSSTYVPLHLHKLEVNKNRKLKTKRHK